jgi:hypothetical protein
MAKSENKPTSVTLSDGRVFEKKRVKVRDLVDAENQPKGKEYLVKYAQFASMLQVNGKQVVLEDILDLYDEDLEILMTLFDDEESKNV